MEEGLLPVSDGLHWSRGRATAGGGMAEDVPGTHAVMRPNRMEGWRCKKCHLIIFRYGQSWEANKKAQMQHAAEERTGEEADAPAEAPAEAD